MEKILSQTNPQSLAKLWQESLLNLPEQSAKAWIKRAEWIKAARPSQLPPDGNWSTWLILAGRGWGKTRTAAEDCAFYATTNPNKNIAVVTPTSKDLRETFFEGQSGILNCLPKDSFVHNRSISEIKLWNGTEIHGYSAGEPERLRGPNFHRAYCFPAGTAVLSSNGERPIEKIKIGDFVYTRKGLRRVTGAALTKKNAEVFKITTRQGKSVLATMNHPFYTSGGYKPLSELKIGDVLCLVDQSSLKGQNTINKKTDITGRQEHARTAKEIGSTYIVRFMNTIRGLSPVVIMFTTLMRTKKTTHQKISKLCRCHNICGFTLLEESQAKNQGRRLLRGHQLFGKRLGRMRLRTTKYARIAKSLLKQERCMGRLIFALQNVGTGGGHSSLLSRNVSFAESRLVRKRGYKSIAASNVTVKQRRKYIRGRPQRPRSLLAQYAGMFFRPHESTQNTAQESVLLKTDIITSIEKQKSLTSVYDISVEHDREFFANGFLVHNCDELASWPYAQDTWDMLMFALRLGETQCIITTTPKPTKLLRTLSESAETSQKVILTTGCTYDNSANLGENYIENIKAKYEGTRLGRQELFAEILSDVVGALWSRSNLEEMRVTAYPDLSRIVVAIDPAITSTEGADETGIIVMGKGIDGHFYVLDDRSGIYTPEGWAREAVALYDKWRADKIIAESNQGGEMVERTLRVIRKNAAIKLVHASRGKVTRAEPVAALYEKNMVHHVGYFAELEDQMCHFKSDFSRKEMGYSPDRVDALVWGGTELMEGKLSILDAL